MKERFSSSPAKEKPQVEAVPTQAKEGLPSVKEMASRIGVRLKRPPSSAAKRLWGTVLAGIASLGIMTAEASPERGRAVDSSDRIENTTPGGARAEQARTTQESPRVQRMQERTAEMERLPQVHQFKESLGIDDEDVTQMLRELPPGMRLGNVDHLSFVPKEIADQEGEGYYQRASHGDTHEHGRKTFSSTLGETETRTGEGAAHAHHNVVIGLRSVLDSGAHAERLYAGGWDPNQYASPEAIQIDRMVATILHEMRHTGEQNDPYYVQRVQSEQHIPFRYVQDFLGSQARPQNIDYAHVGAEYDSELARYLVGRVRVASGESFEDAGVRTLIDEVCGGNTSLEPIVRADVRHFMEMNGDAQFDWVRMSENIQHITGKFNHQFQAHRFQEVVVRRVGDPQLQEALRRITQEDSLGLGGAHSRRAKEREGARSGQWSAEEREERHDQAELAYQRAQIDLHGDQFALTALQQWAHIADAAVQVAHPEGGAQQLGQERVLTTDPLAQFNQAYQSVAPELQGQVRTHLIRILQQASGEHAPHGHSRHHGHHSSSDV